MDKLNRPSLATAALVSAILAGGCSNKEAAETNAPDTTAPAEAGKEEEAKQKAIAEDRARLEALKLNVVQLPKYALFYDQGPPPSAHADEFDVPGYEVVEGTGMTIDIPAQKLEDLSITDKAYSSETGVVASLELEMQNVPNGDETPLVTLVEAKDKKNYRMIKALGDKVFELPADNQIVWDLGSKPGKSGHIPTEVSERRAELNIKGWLVKATVVRHVLKHTEAEGPVYWLKFRVFDQNDNPLDNQPLVAATDVLTALNQVSQSETLTK